MANRSRLRCAGTVAGALALLGAVTASPVLAVGIGLPRTYQVQPVDTPNPFLGSSFGQALINAGDVDRDGEDDVIVSQSPSGNTSPEGQLFLFSGETGRLIDAITAPDSGNPGPGNNPANFGFPFVEKIGLSRSSAPFTDLGSCPGGRTSVTCPNATIGPPDGIPDILAGARGIDVGGIVDIGRAYVLDGATRAVLKRIDMPADERVQAQRGLGFARSVYSPAASPPCEGIGGVGACDALPPKVVNGDLSGDPADTPDILVGAWMYNETSDTAHPDSHCAQGPPGSAPPASPAQCRGAGKEYMYRGEDIRGSDPSVNLATPAWRLRNRLAQRDNPNTTLPTNSELFGQAAVAIGDVGACTSTTLAPGDSCPPGASTNTPDGRPDIRFSVSRADYPVNNPDPAQFDVGASLVLDGATGTFLHTYLHPEPQPKAVFGSSLPAGSQVPPVGDLGDTILPDAFIPAPYQNLQFTNQGRGYIMNGAFKSGRVGFSNLARLDDPTPVSGGHFSISTVGVGDLVPGASTPRNEVLAGAFGPFDSQSAEIINDVQFFNPASERVLQTIRDPDQQGGSAFGGALAPMGDLNEDGFLDFIAAAHLYDLPAGGNEGRIYIFRSDNSPAPVMPTPPGLGAPAPVMPTPPAPTVRILPNMVRPGGSARQSGAKIVVGVRGRLVGTQGRPCAGRVKVGVRFADNRRVTRVARMGSNCRYSVRVSFPVRRLPRSLRPRSRTLLLRVAARFQGNAGLQTDVSPTRRIKVTR